MLKIATRLLFRPSDGVKGVHYSAVSPPFLTYLMTHSHAFWYSLKRALSICIALSLSLSCPVFSFPGDEEFLFGCKRGGRLCLLHVVSTWRVDLLCGRRLCAVLLQHHHWQARENPHGTSALTAHAAYPRDLF